MCLYNCLLPNSHRSLYFGVSYFSSFHKPIWIKIQNTWTFSWSTLYSYNLQVQSTVKQFAFLKVDLSKAAWNLSRVICSLLCLEVVICFLAVTPKVWLQQTVVQAGESVHQGEHITYTQSKHLTCPWIITKAVWARTLRPSVRNVHWSTLGVDETGTTDVWTKFSWFVCCLSGAATTTRHFRCLCSTTKRHLTTHTLHPATQCFPRYFQDRIVPNVRSNTAWGLPWYGPATTWIPWTTSLTTLRYGIRRSYWF
jgi:hypothetical protein